MNRYDPRTPRTLAGLAAVAITAATIALAVVMPAFAVPDGAIDDLATRVATEQKRDQTVTSIDVVAERRPHGAPVAQTGPARGTPLRS